MIEENVRGMRGTKQGNPWVLWTTSFYFKHLHYANTAFTKRNL